MANNTEEHIIISLAEEWITDMTRFIDVVIIPKIHVWVQEYNPNFSVPYTNYMPILKEYFEQCVNYIKLQIGDSFSHELKRYGESVIVPHMLYWIQSSYEEYQEKSIDDLFAILDSTIILPPIYSLEQYYLNMDADDIVNDISSLNRLFYSSQVIVSKTNENIVQSFIRELHSESFQERLMIELRNCISNLMHVFIV